MKILAIMASPRNDGNSESLFREFVKGARESGANVDECFIYKKNINPCIACGSCEKDGHCVLRDDFDDIYEKLEQCDALFIAMPIYFYAMPAPLKTLIDRCQAFFARKYILHNPILPKDAPKRPAYLIAVGGTKGKKLFEPTLAILRYFYDCLDMELRDALLYREIDKKGAVLEHPTAMREAYELGLSTE